MADQIRVIANPFTYLDHEGIPAGTYPFDPAHGQDSRRWIGARIDLSPAPDGKPKTRAIERRSSGDFVLTQRDRKGKAIGRVEIRPRAGQRTHFAYDLSPQPIPLCDHYKFGVREGSLFPADPASAKALGSVFVDPSAALRRAAAAAIAQWETDHGDPPDTQLWPENLRAFVGEADANEPATPGANVIGGDA